ncbi:MAG TPA: FIST N-terminal domain-containing protein [Rubrivivax sp.]|nr:FIST N-terminal domain-containing protein [Rubrivivax sp.]
MLPFVVGHATHPDWRMALSLAGAMLDAQQAPGAGTARSAPTLGFVYFTDHYAAHAEGLLAALRQRWPDVAWVGSVGVGVAASGVEYFDEPALVLMLAELPQEHFRLFSGARPLSGFNAFSALVHADPNTPELAELLLEMSRRTSSGYLFGGLAASRNGTRHIADGVWQGGLSGVAFTQDVALLSRVTQGCQPIGPVRHITAADRNGVLALDGEPALRCLLRDLGATQDEPRVLLPKLRSTLVGLSDGTQAMLARGAMFGADTRVRHLIGVDPTQEVFAVADTVQVGMRLAFCSRNVDAARRDLVRICSELREELTPDAALSDTQEATAQSGVLRAPADMLAAPLSAAQRIAGAIYVSCSGRGGPHFGGASAELQIIQHALGDVPLAGFFAGGEIARHHLYGYTGVLTVFSAG